MKKIIVSMFVLALMLSMLANISNFTEVNALLQGDLEITWYKDSADAYSALKTHQVDFLPSSLTADQLNDAQADPNIQLASHEENGIFEFDINNNYTILTYPNVRSPTNEIKVRQAIANLINKSYVVSNLLDRYTHEIIDVPISNVLDAWLNTSVIGSNYPYSYNPDKAAALLASLGFNDTDGDGYLDYPSDWIGIGNLPNASTRSMPLRFYIRQDHLDRKRLQIT